MDLYIIEAPGKAPFFRGTQADARTAARDHGGTWKPIEVPDRKEDRIAWLNGFAGGLYRDATAAARPVDYSGVTEATARMAAAPRPDCFPTEAMGRDMSAGAVIARSDNPGVDIDGIVETILSAKGHALRRFASAVALAFTKLGGE